MTLGYDQFKKVSIDSAFLSGQSHVPSAAGDRFLIAVSLLKQMPRRSSVRTIVGVVATMGIALIFNSAWVIFLVWLAVLLVEHLK
jgi:hypothetical protein